MFVFWVWYIFVLEGILCANCIVVDHDIACILKKLVMDSVGSRRP